MPAEGYIVEQSLLLAVAAAMLAVQAQQLASEGVGWAVLGLAGMRRIGVVKWVFHRLTPLLTVLLMLRCVDPRGVNGVYSNAAITFLANDATSFIVAGFSLAAYRLLDSTYKLVHERTPSAIIVVFLCADATLIVLANVVGALSIHHDGTTPVRWHGAYLLTCSAVVLAIVVIFNTNVFRIKAIVSELLATHDMRTRMAPTSSEMQSASAHDEPPAAGGTVSRRDGFVTLTNAMRKMQLLQVATTVLAVLTLASQGFYGVLSAMDRLPSNSSVSSQNPQHFRIRGVDVFLWLQFAANIVMTWYAWTPASAGRGGDGAGGSGGGIAGDKRALYDEAEPTFSEPSVDGVPPETHNDYGTFQP
jgi:hypothetical protein